MKKIVEYFKEKQLLFKSLVPISPKALGSRKKIEIYLGVDPSHYYHLVLFVEKKSRILRKEAGDLMGFHTKTEVWMDTKIKKKHILIKAPLCSKAKKYMEENGWRVHEVGEGA